jgi:predicted SprT family Zn-dependent metalloprotease
MAPPHEHDRKLLQASLDAMAAVHEIEPVTLEVNMAFSRMGGMAYPKKRLIQLAGWMMTCPPTDILDTLRHEFAHILAEDKYGHIISAHGYEWQQTAVLVGASPTRCYDGKLEKYWDKS